MIVIIIIVIVVIIVTIITTTIFIIVAMAFLSSLNVLQALRYHVKNRARSTRSFFLSQRTGAAQRLGLCRRETT